MIKSILNLILMLNVAVVAAGAQTERITNGGFDMYVPSNGSGGGWISYAIDFNGGWKETGGNPGAFFALNHGVEETPQPTIYQTVSGLTAGQTYRIAGDRKINLLIQDGTDDSFEVLLDGEPILTLDAPGPQGEWFAFETTFTATNEWHTLSFVAEANGTDTDYGVDNISLTATTSPAYDAAWDERSGWVDFATSAAEGDTPRVVFGRSFLSGIAWSENAGWLNLGDGSPSNGYSYSNVSGEDVGVNHDGRGHLSGYAWSPETGYVNFDWAGVNHPDRPRVDLMTGEFYGYAWNENTGWLNLGTTRLQAERMVRPDTDGDGIEDAFEQRHFGDLNTAGIGTDFDEDGVTDADESIAATDPLDPADLLYILRHTLIAGTTNHQLEFVHSPATHYRIEAALTLTNADWNIIPPDRFAPDAGNSTVRYFSLPQEPTRFFRVIALPPLDNPAP